MYILLTNHINLNIFCSCFQVGTDFLEDEITGIEEHVQSMDVVAFNKV